MFFDKAGDRKLEVQRQIAKEVYEFVDEHKRCEEAKDGSVRK
jgi:hypothetical protein